MTATSTTTVVRHLAFDEVSRDDREALDRDLRAVLATMAGVPTRPDKTPLSFPPIPGAVAPGYRVPPAVGDQLIARLGPAAFNGDDRRGPAAVSVDPKRITRSPTNCLRAVANLLPDLVRRTHIRRGIIAVRNPHDIPAVAAAIAEASGGAVGGVVLAADYELGDQIAAQFARVSVDALLVKTPEGAQPPDLPRPDPGQWTILPPGHAGWADGHLPDPPIIVAAVPLPACRPRVLARLFARPDQQVFALIPAEQDVRLAERFRLHGAYGSVVATCEGN